jgi:hypothetical protein
MPRFDRQGHGPTTPNARLHVLTSHECHQLYAQALLECSHFERCAGSYTPVFLSLANRQDSGGDSHEDPEVLSNLCTALDHRVARSLAC